MFTQMRYNLKFLGSILFALVFLMGGVLVTNSAQAAEPCISGVPAVDSLLVNTTQSITNDVDSGNHGNWAIDNYSRHIQVWQDGTTYCAKVDYNGTFNAPAGVLSPENGAPITQAITGTMIGGYTGSIVGIKKDSPNIPTSVDYQGSISTGAIPVSWLAATFDSGYVFTYLNNGNDWSWTYTTTGNNPHSTWINAGTGSHGDIGPVVNATTSTGYATIQSAISAAIDRDTINIGAGTYTENGQIVIDKNLTIIGVDKTTTIIKPAGDTTSVGHADSAAWILVNSNKTFNLSNVKLNGEGKLIAVGILSHGHGTIDNNIFTNIGYNPSTDYRGIGVELFGSNMTVSNNSFSNIGRIGVFNGNGTNSIISGNTYTGKGDIGTSLDYGFEVGRNGHATISNNIISNNKGVASDGSTSAGILVTSYFNPSTPSSATITGNTISNSTDGIAVGYDEFDASIVVAHNNKFSGNTHAINSTQPSVNATNNYWGNASGPTITSNANGVGDKIIEAVLNSVSFTPWYTNPERTTLSNSTVVPDDSGNAKVTDTNKDVVVTSSTQPLIIDTGSIKDGTIDVGSLVTVDGETKTGTIPKTTINSDVADVEIPATTITSSDKNWDGTINLPKIITTTVQPVASSGNTATAVASIEVGFGETHLTFNDAVKLTFPGQANSLIGWSQNGAFHTISNTCDTNSSSTKINGGATFGNDMECKINVGSDLVVWTKHFTTFTTYTQTQTQVLSNVSSGGYYVKTATPEVPAKVTTPAGKVLGASTQEGKVLGATSFNFTKFIKNGSKGNEIIELQKFLTTLGYTLTTDGNFGAKTKAAVIKFQIANKLVGDGVIGAKTRAVLNK